MGFNKHLQLSLDVQQAGHEFRVVDVPILGRPTRIPRLGAEETSPVDVVRLKGCPDFRGK